MTTVEMGRVAGLDRKCGASVNQVLRLAAIFGLVPRLSVMVSARLGLGSLVRAGLVMEGKWKCFFTV